MSIVDSVLNMFGKKRNVDANVEANRARQQSLHGKELGQTSDVATNTRDRMEAELNRQRDQRTTPPVE
jgi:hypothetical protein